MSKLEEMAKAYQLEHQRANGQFGIMCSHSRLEGYTQGWKDCLKHSEEVKGLEQKLKSIEKEVEVHYKIYGWEKGQYLHDELQKLFGRKFLIYGEENE